MAQNFHISSLLRSIGWDTWTVLDFFLLLDSSFHVSGNNTTFSITENGYWSCLPFLMKAFGEYTSSSIANWLLMKNYVTVDVLRRTCNTIGSLSGLLNGAGGSTSFIVPIIVGILTKNKTLEEWHLVFFISIAVVMFSCVVFAIFGSAKVQPWNFVEEEKDLKSIAMNDYEKKEIPPQISTIVSNGQTSPNFHNHR
ncbi:inorganic phosphate cotransporter [Caerostris extrusa]|uniref:Inorganic phosphate cotransporter n=1 Tax=Caerostris extrusa TaxID=172846 RepID=A0AAV4UNN3_CAEEX|nr:inorganic phosphate cotransporter [Caerostris extrusa]